MSRTRAEDDETTLADIYKVLSEIGERFDDQLTPRDLFAAAALRGLLAVAEPSFERMPGIVAAAWDYAEAMAAEGVRRKK